MKKYVLIAAAMLALSACEPEKDNRDKQAKAAADAANALQFTDNAEIENIKWRLELTSKPGLLGYILLMNDAGQPILYEAVKGKITSGSKRLTKPQRLICNTSGCGVVSAPSDEGTHGTSGEYVYYRNIDGAYRQWNGRYFYSDQPFRLSVEPLVVSVKP